MPRLHDLYAHRTANFRQPSINQVAQVFCTLLSADIAVMQVVTNALNAKKGMLVAYAVSKRPCWLNTALEQGAHGQLASACVAACAMTMALCRELAAERLAARCRSRHGMCGGWSPLACCAQHTTLAGWTTQTRS